jgi:hypothetical protein
MSSTAIATSASESSSFTSTSWVRICASTTYPHPLGVSTRDLFRGNLLRSSSYVSSSYRRQHINRPHRPEIFRGSSVAFWIFADFIEIGFSTFRNRS